MEEEKIPEYKPPESDDEENLPDTDGTEEAGESSSVTHEVLKWSLLGTSASSIDKLELTSLHDPGMTHSP